MRLPRLLIEITIVTIVSVLCIPLFNMMQVEAAPGNFAVYRDSTNDTLIALTPSTTYITWDTTVDVSNLYTLQGNNYDIQLGESGHYFVSYSVHTEHDSGTYRTNSIGWLELDGTDSEYGYSKGYIRRTASAYEGYNSGAAIIYADSGDMLAVEMQRRDTNTATARQRTDKAGINILKLKDSWDYLRLHRSVRSSSVHTWTSFTDVDWDTQDELDTGSFSWSSGTADEIELIGYAGDHFLVTVSIGLNQDASSSTRQNYEMRLALDGTGIDGTTVTTIIRGNPNSNGDYDGATSYTGIITKQSTSNETLTVQLRRESVVGVSTDMIADECGITIVKIPNLADYIRLVDFDGSQDLPTARSTITWDTTLEEDSGSFDHNTTYTSRVDIDMTGDYLFFSSAFTKRSGTGTVREEPFLEWRLDGSTLLTYGGHGSLNRGTQSTTSSYTSGSSGAIIIDNLTASQYIELTQINEAANDDSYYVSGGLGLQGVRIDSLFLPPIPYTSQKHFRWRDDTVSLNGTGGWLDNEDSNSIGEIEQNEVTRLRIESANEGNDVETAARSYELQWGEKNGSCAGVSAWTGIANSSDEFEMYNTTNITDGQATTAGLLANSESYTFVNGEGKDTGDTTSSIGPMNNSYYTELEYSIRPTSSASFGTTYCFRLYDTNNTEELNDYAVYPEITVGTPSTDQLHYRWRDDTTDLNTGGGWLATEDTNPTTPTEIQDDVRLRVEIANTGTHDEASARTYELEWGLKSTTCSAISTWTGVGDSSDDFDMVASTNIDPDGETTTPGLLNNSETYTYTAGRGMDISDTTASIGALEDEYYTEIEYSFEPTVNATTGATYCFRLYDATAGETLDNYSVYPEMTIVNPHTTQMHFRWRDDTTDLNSAGGWITTEDSNPSTTITKGDTYRLRLEVANSGDYIEGAAKTYELQWGEKTSTCSTISSWIGVANTDDAIEMVATTHIDPDGESTTSGLLSNSESYTRTNGEGRESADTTGNIGPMDTAYYTEFEYSIKATEKSVTGTTYCFRVYDTTSAEELDSYKVYPELQIDYKVSDSEGLMMEWDTKSGVTDDGWTDISFKGNYTSPVFVCAPEYSNNQGNESDGDNDSIVCRVQNVTSTSAQIRLQEPGAPGSLTDSETVHWMVVEDGSYDTTNIKMEAFTYTSTVTDSDSSWVGQSQTLSQTYTNPVAVGSVTTYNDPDYSVFWSHNGSRGAATSASFYAGKHVAEDPDTTRSDETIAVIVIEEANDTLNGITYETQLQGQTIERVDDSHTNYTFNQAFSSTPDVAITSITGISGGNGGHIVLYDEGSGVMSSTNIYLVAMEEEIGDTEMNGNAEYGPYIVFETAGASFIALDQTNYQFFNNNDGVQPGSSQASENTTTTDVETTEVLRLRMSVQAGMGDLKASDKSFKLQYGQGSDCSAVGSWVDVDGTGGSGIWRGYNNSNPADGANITSSLLNDNNNTLQTYQEQNNSPSNPNLISKGDWGEWDWVVQNNGATANTDYCFRMVTSDGDTLNYYRYPQLTTSPVSYTQNDFEWYVTADSVNLSNIWPEGNGANLNENEALTQLPASNEALINGDKIRVQMNLTTSKSNLDVGTQKFRLEYSAANDCTTAGSWATVGDKGSGTVWRFFDETSIGDSTEQNNHISTSDTGSEGYYSEINPTDNNPNAVNIGENSEWDWPIENNGAAENTTYCFRMTLEGGTVFNTYNADSYPKLTTAPGISNLLRHGNYFKDQDEKGYFWTD